MNDFVIMVLSLLVGWTIATVPSLVGLLGGDKPQKRTIIGRLMEAVGKGVYAEVRARSIEQGKMRSGEFCLQFRHFFFEFDAFSKIQPELEARFVDLVGEQKFRSEEDLAEARQLIAELLHLRFVLTKAIAILNTDLWEEIEEVSGVRKDLLVGGELLFVDKFTKFLLAHKQQDPVVEPGADKGDGSAKDDAEQAD